MTNVLAGHHALVTGAGSGIGEAIARTLHEAGAKVTLAGRRAEPLVVLSGELGPDRSLVLAGFDVTSRGAVETGLEEARKAFGPVTIVINNAGQAPSAPFHKTSVELWEKVIGVDLTGVFHVAQACLADLKAAGPRGRLINIASIAGLKGFSYVTAYCAAKHGVIGLTRALAHELATTGVTVNAVCPGYTDTPLVSDAVDAIMSKTGRSKDEVLAELTKGNPQGRLIDPQEIADAVLYLASPAARSVNGQAITIAGGEVM